jgi:ketosteroid isomerase-like protein
MVSRRKRLGGQGRLSKRVEGYAPSSLMEARRTEAQNPVAARETSWFGNRMVMNRDSTLRLFLSGDHRMTTFARNMVWAAVVFSSVAQGQSQVSAVAVSNERSPVSTLQTEIAAADSALFAAFNARDLPRFRAFFARDLEFYQDNEGLEDYARTMKDFVQMFGQPTQIRRELVAGTFEVYPIKSYGAIETGSHRFCHAENGKEDCGTFKFVHIWRRTKAGWKITRVVSYAH